MTARRVVAGIGGLALLFGLYLFGNVVSPSVNRAVVVAKQPVNSTNKLIMPSASINVPIIEGGEEALGKGAWHRYPDRGNPTQGGNMILSGHSFLFAWNPLKTREQSYFYNLYRAKIGDAVYIDWDGQRYSYKVSKTYEVKPNAISIEAPSDQAHLTIYTCTAGGSSDGRVVVEAVPTFMKKTQKVN